MTPTAAPEAENGREGLDRLDAARPGVVLLDLPCR